MNDIHAAFSLSLCMDDNNSKQERKRKKGDGIQCPLPPDDDDPADG